VETFKQLHAALVASNLNTSNVSVLSAEDSREKLKTSYIKGGFFQPVAGQFWPAKFCYGVAKVS
jgi:glycine/D-amino acid oxidase-like deaminating enzyme